MVDAAGRIRDLSGVVPDIARETLSPESLKKLSMIEASRLPMVEGTPRIGPWLVTRDEVPDPQNLRLWLEVDGRRYQDGTTKTMVFGVAHLVSYLSRFMSLQPGDIISTGTPPGVGFGQKPPVYLRPGNVMRLGIDGLGEQRQEVVAWS